MRFGSSDGGLLGGYVFGIIWVVPGLAVALAASLGFGARANLFNQLFQALVAGRLKPATAAEAATEVRFSELLQVAVQSVATLAFAVGASPVGRIVPRS